jgi:hypothetical protein
LREVADNFVTVVRFLIFLAGRGLQREERDGDEKQTSHNAHGIFHAETSTTEYPWPKRFDGNFHY